MWLDADDVLDEENLEKLKSLKETLNPGTDVVMMEYAAGFDQSGRTTFSLFRVADNENIQKFQMEWGSS